MNPKRDSGNLGSEHKETQAIFCLGKNLHHTESLAGQPESVTCPQTLLVQVGAFASNDENGAFANVSGVIADTFQVPAYK